MQPNSNPNADLTRPEASYTTAARELIAAVGIADMCEEHIAYWAAVAGLNADCLATAVYCELHDEEDQR